MENNTNHHSGASEQKNGLLSHQPAGQKGVTVAKIFSDAKDFFKKAKEARAEKRNSAVAGADDNSSESSEIKINPFPVEAFPEAVQQIIWETDKCLNYPVDFIGASLLCAAGIAIGVTHKIQAKRTWCESPVMYLALVGKSGTTKTHPLSFALRPISEYDNESNRKYQEQKAEYDYVMSLNKKERDELGMIEPVKPVWKRFLVSDVTPEGLAEVHKFNPRGIALYADELASWVMNFNRYNKGSEEQFWLSAWSGKPIIIDRKSSDPILINFPSISVVGTIQNGILKELSGNGKSQNGFIDRILFAYPGYCEKPGWTEVELDELVIQNWNEVISRLLDLPFQVNETGNPEPKVVQFDPEAKKLFIEWFDRNASMSNATDEEARAGIYAKLDQYTLRFALILQLLRWACGEGSGDVVEVEAVSGAVKLAEYFRQTALKVRDIISNPLGQLPENKQKLYEALPDTFTTAEGLEIAQSLTPPVPPDTYHKFLGNYSGKGPLKLFKRLGRGVYEKLV